MGHKITPISNRLSVGIRNPKSSWVSSYDYAELINKDLKLRNYIKKLISNIDHQPKGNSSLRGARLALGLIRTKYRKNYKTTALPLDAKDGVLPQNTNKSKTYTKKNTNVLVNKRDRMLNLLKHDLPVKTATLFGSKLKTKIKVSLPITKTQEEKAKAMSNGLRVGKEMVYLVPRMAKKLRNIQKPSVNVFIQAISKSQSIDLFTAAPTLYPRYAREKRVIFELRKP